MRRHLVTATALAGALAVATGVPAVTHAAPQHRTRWIVRYASAGQADTGLVQASSEGAQVRHRFSRVFPGAVVSMTAAQANVLRTLPGVTDVRPDTVLHAAGVENNPPANLDRIDQRSRTLSHTYSSHWTGKGVRIYVVDSGLNLHHVDFKGRVKAGPNFADVDITQGDDPFSKAPQDCHGHGTHVAGIAAGTSKGVAKGATVVPVKVLTCDGSGYASDTIAALDWIVRNHTAGQPAVVNMSLTGPADPQVDAAVSAVLRDGVQVVTAAGNASPGNSNRNACSLSPSRVRDALTVANSTIDDRQAPSSFRGRCVDLFAPGTAVVSDFAGSSTATATMTGTSMAAPAVTGAAALVLQARPRWTPAQVRAQLLGKTTNKVLRGVSTGTPNKLLYTLGGVTPGDLERVGRSWITGTAARGQRLVAHTGTWGNGRVHLSLRWYRVSAKGVRTAIPGASHATLLVSSGQRGYRVQLAVTGSTADHLSRTSWSSPTATIR